MIKHQLTNRGFNKYVVDTYAPRQEEDLETNLVQESSAIDIETKDGLSNPGSSYLWIGKEGIHLNREEVAEFIKLLQHWLDTKRLPSP